MKNEQKKSNNIPYVIIGVVLVVVLGVVALGTGVVGSGWWSNKSAKTTANNANRPANSTAAKTPQTPINAPPGAQPPNLLGSPTALVTVEEFADFQCGSCAAVHPTMKEIQKIYGSKIKFIFRNFPLAIPAHDKAYEAAVAAEAAGMQDRNKFWVMQDQLFTNQAAWTMNPNYRQLWLEYATKIGLDVEKFQSDMAGIASKSRVDQDLQRGRAYSVSSTPTVFVNGQQVPFPSMDLTALRQIIDAELQTAAAKTAQPTNTASVGNAASNAK